MDSGPCQDVASPMGGTPKAVSGRMNVFRRLSLGKSDPSSVPSVVALEECSTFSEEFRDEVSSFTSDDKNKNNYNNKNNKNKNNDNNKSKKKNNYNNSNNRTSSYSTTRESTPRRDDIHLSDDIVFNPFELIPSWGFDARGEKYANGNAQPQSPENFNAFKTDKDSRTRSVSKTKKAEHEHQPNTSRPIILIRPAALKLDQWSNALVRKKNQFKYHSFTNERRRSKKNSRAKQQAMSEFDKPMIEYRDDIEQIDYRPENFPSLNNEPVMNDLFPPNVHDESQGALIGPLLPNTKLKLVVHEIPKDSNKLQELVERDPPPPPPLENLALEPVFLQEQHIAPNDVVIANDKKSNLKHNGDSKIKEQKGKTKGKVVYETSDYPSDGTHSSVISGDTENLPLLRTLGMNAIDCNNCGTSKAKKKLDAKKKRIEVKKKFVEELWERKQFYWKYESVEDQQREYTEQLDTLVFKIAPETNDTHDNCFIEMPLGFQLSAITEGDEGDEDITACCSPRSLRSLARSFSVGAGSIRQDGKVSLNTPVESLLDMTNKDSATPCGPNEKKCGSPEEKSPEPEQPKMPMRSAHHRRVLSVNEIVVNSSFDDGSDGKSKGGISDITEDYLHIPFSSPLYKKVLKAFREAAEKKGENNDTTEEINYLHWI